MSLLKNANDSIKQLEIEARNLPSDMRAEMLKKVQQYKDACKVKDTQIKTYRTKYEEAMNGIKDIDTALAEAESEWNAIVGG